MDDPGVCQLIPATLLVGTHRLADCADWCHPGGSCFWQDLQKQLGQHQGATTIAACRPRCRAKDSTALSTLAVRHCPWSTPGLPLGSLGPWCWVLTTPFLEPNTSKSLQGEIQCWLVHCKASNAHPLPQGGLCSPPTCST